MRNKPQKQDRAARVYSGAVDVLVNKTRQWGYMPELTKQFSKRVGHKVHRQVIDIWLHEDPAKRSHPDYGNVILLLLAAEDTDRVMAERAKAKES